MRPVADRPLARPESETIAAWIRVQTSGPERRLQRRSRLFGYERRSTTSPRGTIGSSPTVSRRRESRCVTRQVRPARRSIGGPTCRRDRKFKSLTEPGSCRPCNPANDPASGRSSIPDDGWTSRAAFRGRPTVQGAATSVRVDEEAPVHGGDSVLRIRPLRQAGEEPAPGGRGQSPEVAVEALRRGQVIPANRSSGTSEVHAA